MKRTNPGLELRKKQLADCEQSGKSIQQYCNEEKIPYHTFLYWRKKIKREISKPAGFIRFSPKPLSLAEARHAEVIFANGNRVVLFQAASADFIKQLAG